MSAGLPLVHWPQTALAEISGIQVCTATPSTLDVRKPDSSDVQQGWGSFLGRVQWELFVWYGLWYGHHEDHHHA